MIRPGLYLPLFTCLLPLSLLAQRYSGSWFGRAEVKADKTYNSYLIDLSIVKKGNLITGELQYFFGKQTTLVKVKGRFWPATKTIELDSFPIVSYFSNEVFAPDCMMDGSLTLYVDGKDSVLFGQLNPTARYRHGCPVMEIRLQKEKTEDIAPEPEAEEGQEGITAFDSLAVGSRTSAGFLKQYSGNKVPEENRGDRMARVRDSIHLDHPAVRDLLKRKFADSELVMVAGDSVELHLYDNGQPDNDSVSVFLNRTPILLKQVLGVRPLVLKIALQPGLNEIALFAENLGEIPPNTALCMLFANGRRYDIKLSSSLTDNATLRLMKTEKEPKD